MIFDASDNSFINGADSPYYLIDGVCTIFHSAMHENRPVVFAVGSVVKPKPHPSVNKAQLLDYTLKNTWEESKHDFRLIQIYVLISCKKYTDFY